MSRISNWIIAMSGAGAVANAGRACQQRRDEEAQLNARLAGIATPIAARSAGAA